MSLSAIASKLDQVIDAKQPVAENYDNSREQAIDLLRYVFSKDLLPDSATAIGEALEAGALAVETENGVERGTISIEALCFLESAVASFRNALIERMGGDAEGRPDMNPVDFTAQYYQVHGKFPASADKKVIAGAMKKLAGLPKK